MAPHIILGNNIIHHKRPRLYPHTTLGYTTGKTTLLCHAAPYPNSKISSPIMNSHMWPMMGASALRRHQENLCDDYKTEIKRHRGRLIRGMYLLSRSPEVFLGKNKYWVIYYHTVIITFSNLKRAVVWHIHLSFLLVQEKWSGRSYKRGKDIMATT